MYIYWTVWLLWLNTSPVTVCCKGSCHHCPSSWCGLHTPVVCLWWLLPSGMWHCVLWKLFTVPKQDVWTLSMAHLDKLSWLFYDSWRRALSKTGTGDPRLLLGSEVYTSDLLDRPVGATWAQWPGRLHLPGSHVDTNDLPKSTVGANQHIHQGGSIPPLKAIQSSQLDSYKFGILLEPVTSSQVPGGWICISDYTSK